MKFQSDLFSGHLLKRYKRFLADVQLDDGTLVTAHCPNTGSMLTCAKEGDRVFLSKSSNPERKLAYTWELTQTDQGYIGVNTSMTNEIVGEALHQGLFEEFRKYTTIKAEAKFRDNTRFDFFLEGPEAPSCYLEVKNVTLFHDNCVMFPDAITSRGLKHLNELAHAVKLGFRGVVLFLVNRPEGHFFSPADHIDADYGKRLRQVQEAGVEILAYRTSCDVSQVTIGSRVATKLDI